MFSLNAIQNLLCYILDYRYSITFVDREKIISKFVEDVNITVLAFSIRDCRLRILAESKGYRLDDTGLFLATQTSGGKRVSPMQNNELLNSSVSSSFIGTLVFVNEPYVSNLM